MTRFARRSGVVFTLLLLASGLGAAEAPQGADAAEANALEAAALEAYVDGIVNPLMKQNGSPSGVVVIARDGETLLAKGYGFEDVAEQKPVDPASTLFRPGSVSKLFTWVAVMQLVEQGELDLDADVNTYLKTFRIRDSFDDPVTLRHILTHTPGFEDGALGYLILDDPERAMPLRDAMERYQPERVNPPGAQTAYSNYATSLAGLIVENVSGTPFVEYVQSRILEPLGMRDSTFAEPLPEELAGQMATSYGVEAGAFAEKPFEIISNFAPAGALSATATDMVRFAQAVLDGGELEGNRILAEATLDQMLTRAFSHDDRLMGMALGFYETDYNGHRVLGHGGDTRWFHSQLGIDLESRLAFFVSFGGPGGSPVRTAFVPALYDHLFPRAEAPPVPPGGFAERAGRYAGSYGFWRNSFTKIDKALGLANVIQVAPTADDTLVVSFGGKAKQYAEIEENLFRETTPGITLAAGINPRLIAFQEDAQGAITGFVMDGLPFMSTRKLPVYATPNFNFTLLGVSLLVLLGVLLRRFYQRAAIRGRPAAERSVLNAALCAAGAQLGTVVAGVVVLSIVRDGLFSEVPLLFKLWLVLPIVATLITLYLAYRTYSVWKGRLLASVWARARFTVVTLSALFMCWFYYYWNILGFRYL
jgi:CubicO group peptidase (beta-lactamase class C family)